MRHGRVWMASLFAAVLLLGCAEPAERTSTDSGAVRSASLKEMLREPVLTIEDRREWREFLGWSDDCELAFEFSSAGEGAGLEFLILDEGRTLVEVLCAAGAYQPSFLYFMIDTRDAQLRSSRVEFPTYESPDGRTLIPVRHLELWGEPSYLPGSRELAVLRLARQTGDCGTWALYGFSDNRAELREFRVGLPCPAGIELAVDPDPGVPPAGWRKIGED